MAVKFPLKMADGAMVRTIEELREHFDLEAVLAYYDNGRLAKWLENGYYDDEAKKVSALDARLADFIKELCGILGISYSESEAGQMDLGDISRRNKRLERLKRITADNTILEKVDQVALTQEDFVEILDKGITDVYLYGEQFVVPEGFEEICYYRINNPVVKYAKVENLKKVAEEGDAVAQAALGDCYYKGCYVEKNSKEAVKWYRLAAEQGDADAQRNLGYCYWKGIGVEKDDKESTKWYRLAAE